jgi:hypothetical protein
VLHVANSNDDVPASGGWSSIALSTPAFRRGSGVALTFIAFSSERIFHESASAIGKVGLLDRESARPSNEQTGIWSGLFDGRRCRYMGDYPAKLVRVTKSAFGSVLALSDGREVRIDIRPANTPVVRHSVIAHFRIV